MFFKCLAWFSVRQVAAHNTLKAADVSWVLFFGDPEIIPSSVMELGTGNQEEHISKLIVNLYICKYIYIYISFEKKMQNIKWIEVYNYIKPIFNVTIHNHHEEFLLYSSKFRGETRQNHRRSGP